MKSNGDSGGPLMGQITNARIPHTVLVGVVSYGPKNCGTKDIPGVYTRYIQKSSLVARMIIN